MSNRLRHLFLHVMFCFSLMGCQSEQTHEASQKTATVKAERKAETLYFSGTIEPLTEAAVSVPSDAIVKDIYFNYGSLVNKGDKLVLLDSPQQKKEYDEALTSYLKAKDDLDIAEAKFSGTQTLWEAGLIAENAYKADHSALFTSKIAFLQAKTKLIQFLSHQSHTNENIENVLQLTLSNFNKVKTVLGKTSTDIVLSAPTTGIALAPPHKDSNRGEEIRVGAQLKQSDVVTLIGDMTGLSINITIPEVNIDKIKPGMKAMVSGIGFPGINLPAYVARINAQASATQGAGGSLPVFTATVVVPKLTATHREKIKIGMSAAVNVTLGEKDVVMVPVKALTNKAGKTWATVKSADGEFHQVVVETGYSTGSDVLIVNGLTSGDVITWQE